MNVKKQIANEVLYLDIKAIANIDFLFLILVYDENLVLWLLGL